MDLMLLCVIIVSLCVCSAMKAANNITGSMEGNPIVVTSAAAQSVNQIILGVSIIAVLVIILLMSMVFLCYMSHQKGTYYTHEALAFKSDPEMQEVTESPEDLEEEKP